MESNHAIHFCSKSMHARIQCLSLILTGMSILEHVKMSTYLVSLAGEKGFTLTVDVVFKPPPGDDNIV
jgi:hypothetical protein